MLTPNSWICCKGESQRASSRSTITDPTTFPSWRRFARACRSFESYWRIETMTGERITYRKVIRATHSKFLGPTHGLGAGLGETGIVLNRILNTERRSSPQVRSVTVEGSVVKETPGYLILKRDRGAVLRIRKADIVQRSKI